MVEIRLLGPVEVAVDGEPVDVGGVKQRTVLAVLASRVGSSVSEDQLIHAVWGEDAPENAVRSLQTYVSNLRALLDSGREGLIERGQGGYRLNPELAAVDAHGFEGTLAAEEDRSVEELRKALGLWRGRPLGELADDEWAGGLVAHWERLHLQATGQLMSARMAEGQHAEMIDELEGLVAAHPLHEPFWGHLMLALYRSGRQADALDAFKRANTILGEELGIEPGPDLQDLEEKILLQDPALAPSTRTPHNLPAERTRLIGRESEIDEARRLVERTRLLTLTGAGGVGKTRLAQAVAHQVLDEYPDGAWFIDLAPLAEADLVMKRIAAVLDVEPPVLRPVEEVVVEAIGSRRMLFVLDNCEHLIEAAATAASSLLEAPSVDVLATSRETLRVDGELAWRVPSLPVPSEGAEADGIAENETVQLFRERASAVEPSFRLDAENVDAVGSVCRDLDGIPLAVELAAARIATLTPQELHRRLDQRFALLTGGSRTALARHRTLEAAIEWSYELLNDEEQDLFNRLSLFAGPFDMNAATAVSPYEEVKALDIVDGLVAKSLLIPERYEPKRRFRMLETLRQYGLRQLEEQGLVDDAHNALLRWAHELTAEVGPRLMTPDQVMVTKELDVDINSIRSAMNWALESDQYEVGLRIASDISRYWYLRALSAEGADWYDQFVEEPESISEDTLARGLVASSATLVRVGRSEEAFEQAGEALALIEESDNTGLLGWAHYQRGVASFDLIDIEESRKLFLKAQNFFKDTGTAIGLGLAVLLENGTWLQIDPEEALRRSIALTEQMEAANVPVGVAHSTEVVGVAALKTGDLDLALERYQQALPIYDEIRVYACQAHCLDGVAMCLITSGRPTEGAVVVAGTEEVRRSLSTIQAPYEKFFDELEDFRDRMGQEYPDAVAHGRSLKRPELVDYAIEALRSTH